MNDVIQSSSARHLRDSDRHLSVVCCHRRPNRLLLLGKLNGSRDTGSLIQPSTKLHKLMNANYKMPAIAAVSGLVMYGTLSYIITMLFSQPSLTLFAQVFAIVTFLVMVSAALLYGNLYSSSEASHVRDIKLIMWIGISAFAVVETMSFINAHFFDWWLALANSPYMGDQSKIDSLVLQNNVCLIALSCVALFAVCTEIGSAFARLMNGCRRAA